VDVRVKTFAQEVTLRLGFLRAEHGFTGPELEHDDTGVYPLMGRLRFKRGDLVIEVTLVLSYMGEEYVATSLVYESRSDSGRRTEVGHSTAHTGYQMRRALDAQAEAVRTVLREQPLSTHD
jgi:hypothetical protein